MVRRKSHEKKSSVAVKRSPRKLGFMNSRKVILTSKTNAKISKLKVIIIMRKCKYIVYFL